MSFHILKAGMLATIQDSGRLGLSDKGLSQSGVLDEQAYYWANRLLDNAPHTPVIEVTVGPIVWRASKTMNIAITGADCGFMIDNQAIPLWQVVTIEKGQTLHSQTARRGLRAYIAAQGGIHAPSYWGSASVNVREKIGQIVQKGDRVATGDYSPIAHKKAVPSYYQPDYQLPLTLRFMPGYQFESFTETQLETLLQQPYYVDSASDRTGCRLTGKTISPVPTGLVSEGIAYGSIEITTAGYPIVLLKDRPTIGGYPKVGTVVSLDLAGLAQRPAGSEVRFSLCSLSQAQAERKVFERFFRLH